MYAFAVSRVALYLGLKVWRWSDLRRGQEKGVIYGALCHLLFVPELPTPARYSGASLRMAHLIFFFWAMC